MEQHVQFHKQLKLERERLGLSQAELAERIKSNVKTITRWENGENLPQPYHRRLFSELFSKSLEELGLVGVTPQPEQTCATKDLPRKEEWGDAPRSGPFYGRKKEQAELRRWIVEQRCHVIAILGIGGIGKSSLTAQTAMQVADSFTAVFWGSLRNAPPLDLFLQQCLQMLSLESQPLPTRSDELLSLLLRHLQAHRCLLVLDNFESILQSGQSAGQYREGYEQYGNLLQRLGEVDHQSCLLLTSREKPREITRLEGKRSLAHSLPLAGVGQSEGQELLQERDLTGRPEDWAKLIHQYSGNPLALKLVADPIQELFEGRIATFLQTEEMVFGNITDLLDQHFQRLTPKERELLYWLAIEREAITWEELQANLVHSVARGELLTALDSLGRRFLLEKTANGRFTLQPVIQEYVTNEIMQRAYDEFGTDVRETWSRYAFMKAQAKEYIRESQKRLLLAPIARWLLDYYGQAGLERKIQALLADLRTHMSQQNNYMVGNILNLLLFCHSDLGLRVNLSTFDFSQLPIRQAYLQEVALSNVNFSGAYFRECVFTNTFGDILSVTFSPDGQLLAAGTSNGEIWLYSLQQEALVRTLSGHTDGVWSVAFSPDGKFLASGSDDQTVCLWEPGTGQCVQILSGHTNRVRAVAFSPDGSLLATAGEDQTIHLRSMPEGTLLRTLIGHTSRIWSIDFSSDGKYLASGSVDCTVCIWEVTSGDCVSTIEYTSWIRCVRFSPDGCLLASVGDDQAVHVWDRQEQKDRHTFTGHTNSTWSLAFTPNGQTLISSGEDANLCLWDLHSGAGLKVLQGHDRGIRAIAVDDTGQWLASGGEDQAIHLWDLSTGVCTKIFRGYTNRVWYIDSSQSTLELASCSEDGCIRLWDLDTRQCRQTFKESTHGVRCVALQPDGIWLASSGKDHTVRLWEHTGGQRKYILRGHSTWIRTVAFSPDGLSLAAGGEDGVIYVWDMRDPVRASQRFIIMCGQTWIRSVAFQPHGDLLASGSDDQTICLWNRQTGQCIQTLRGHDGRVRSVAFHPDGNLLASGSEDGTIRLWDLTTWDCVGILKGHIQRVLTVAFSSDGRLLASGSNDSTVRIWCISERTSEGQTHKLCSILQGHKGQIRSVTFHTNTSLLASASEDGTIKLWSVKECFENGEPVVDGTCVDTLISGRPYERMNISGVQGLTDARRLSLVALGAVDDGG